MRLLILYLILAANQVNTLQDKPVVRLPLHQSSIAAGFDGDLVELKNALPSIQLPQLLPSQNPCKKPWQIEVKNLGPGTVTVYGRAGFSVQVTVGKSVVIKSTDTGFVSVK